MSRPDRTRPGHRGQTVLLAAAVIALALVPLGVAYVGLGAHPDVETATDAPDGERAVAGLERSLANAQTDGPSADDWGNRTATVETVRTRMAPAVDRLETAGVDDGVARSVTYNATAAREWAAENCPGGPARQFGDCEAVDGVVVQNRLNETHVLAAAFDVRITTDRGTTRLTVVVTVWASDERGGP